jgi:penicillin-binding protein 2
MGTALETGIYSLYNTLNCGHSMWVCDSATLYDWTYSYGVASSGELNLSEGLMRSCNPWFYRIGERLYEEDLLDALPNMAYGFGLGVETGIDIPEASGNIPLTTNTCMDNAQMAIGQGEVLVTPLQVVRFFAALANGGTLYRPALVESIGPASGDPIYAFEPEPQGELPLSDKTLSAIQEGLRMVVEETRGTGYWAMEGLNVLVSGKTGTAQTPTGNSHAWFAGYTRQNDPQRPDIAVVVLIENGGEGSVMAAPVFRRAVSLYFSNYENPAGNMPWEEAPYVPIQTTEDLTDDSTSND